MATNIKVLDPVQGLIDYVNDIKPYHTKIIESLVEYVGQEAVDVNLLEEFLLNIDLAYSYNINGTICLDGGFGSLPFDDPDVIPVLSPDPAQTIAEYPAFTTNSFIVAGDQRQKFDPSSNLTFKIASYIDDRIVDVTTSVGSPETGGEFYLLGDRTGLTDFPTGTVFIVTGSTYNDGAYKVTNTPTYSAITNSTKIPVNNQLVNSDIVDGFMRKADSNNVGSFSVVSSIFTEGTSSVNSYTTVFVSGLTFVPPPPALLDDNQRYVSIISVGALEYKKILSYSNVLRYYDASPANLLQEPNEGIVYPAIVNLSQGSPAYFVVAGNFENSNIFVGDEFFVTGSTDNDRAYNITSIEYVFEPLINDYGTRFGVSSIHDGTIDGSLKLYIPSNVFIVDGDYTDFFKQGVRIKAITGSKAGTYMTLSSTFINDETHIRVHEDLISRGRGRMVVSAVTSPGNGFVVEGNVESTFRQNTQFNVIGSLRNDGSYTCSIDSVYSSVTNTTTIYINEAFDSTDFTGELHEFVKGSLTYMPSGFGATPELCEVVPETLVKVGIVDRLYIDNIGIWTYDDILTYGIGDEQWGFDLPPTTIFASGAAGEPVVTISATPPGAPVEDTLWFDTSLNTGSPSGPGTLKQYSYLIEGSPVPDWVEVPNNKAYWIDTDTNYMYYRLIYQHYDNSVPGYPIPSLVNNLDTGWILEYTEIPGYNDLITGHGSREQIGFETFFAVESTTAVANTVFNLSTISIPVTGSPEEPNPLMLEVYVNNAIANVNILSTTSFEIINPRLRVDDFVEARIFDNTAIASNAFIGTFDANAAIAETFDMLKGYKFHIDGTQAAGNKIYIPDTVTGEVFAIFAGSPIADTAIEITDSAGSPTIDGNYTITDVTQYGSPISHVVLTVAESLPNTGIFGGSPLIESGKALYQQWFQYLIVNTTANTIAVLGDATGDIVGGSPAQSIRIAHSDNTGASPILGSPVINNDGVYTVSVAPTYDGRKTLITTVETITNIGNSGGWVESL